MAAPREAKPADRRKRVQVLKKLIILSLFTFILIPVLLCVALFIRLHTLEKQIAQLQADMADLVELAKQAENVSAEMRGTGSGQETEREPETVEASVEPEKKPESQETAPAENVEEESSEETRKVYLTFDDGPSSHTDEILDILAEYDVKATFFVIGKEGEWAENAYRRIVEEGHTLGMHSYTHEYKSIYASVEAYEEDLLRLQDYLYEVTGVKSIYVRFPGGSSNKVSPVDMREFISYLNEAGMYYYDWNVASGDASSPKLSAQEILDNCMEGVPKHDSVIILMHDTAGKDTTVEALPLLIEAIQAMENTELLPITEDTVPVQHITITQGEMED